MRQLLGMGYRSNRKLGETLATAISALMLVAFVTGCAGNQAPAPTAAPKAAEAKPTVAPAAQSTAAPAKELEPYKVGLATAFTGTRAETYDSSVKAVRLETEIINAAGGINGHKIQIVEYDTEEDPQKSMTVFKRLIEQDKVVGIVGVGINAAVQAVKPLLANGPVSAFISGSAKPEPDSYQFQATITQPVLQRLLFQYFKQNNFGKVALLATTDATGEDAVKNIQGISKEIGGVDVVVERFNANDVDVTPQLTKIRSDKAIKALVIWTTGKQAATAVKGAAQVGLDIPIQVSYGNHTNTFIKLISDSMPKTLWIATDKGTVWQDLPDSDPVKPVAKAFSEAYQKKYNQRPDLQAFSGYDNAKLIFDALKAVGPDAKQMKEWIESQPLWVGAGLEHKFTKTNHEGDLPVSGALVEIVGDGWKMVK